MRDYPSHDAEQREPASAAGPIKYGTMASPAPAPSPQVLARIPSLVDDEEEDEPVDEQPAAKSRSIGSSLSMKILAAAGALLFIAAIWGVVFDKKDEAKDAATNTKDMFRPESPAPNAPTAPRWTGTDSAHWQAGAAVNPAVPPAVGPASTTPAVPPLTPGVSPSVPPAATASNDVPSAAVGANATASGRQPWPYPADPTGPVQASGVPAAQPPAAVAATEPMPNWATQPYPNTAQRVQEGSNPTNPSAAMARRDTRPATGAGMPAAYTETTSPTAALPPSYSGAPTPPAAAPAMPRTDYSQPRNDPAVNNRAPSGYVPQAPSAGYGTSGGTTPAGYTAPTAPAYRAPAASPSPAPNYPAPAASYQAPPRTNSPSAYPSYPNAAPASYSPPPTGAAPAGYPSYPAAGGTGNYTPASPGYATAGAEPSYPSTDYRTQPPVARTAADPYGRGTMDGRYEGAIPPAPTRPAYERPQTPTY